MVGKRSLAKQLHWLHLPIMIALPLIIVGVLKLFGEGSASQKSTGKVIAAIGLAQFIATFFIQSATGIFVTTKLRAATRRNKVYFVVVNSMVPLIILRLTYGVLSFFVTSTKLFSPNTGNIAAQIVMSVLPENLVAFIGLSLGFLWGTLPQAGITTEQHHHRLASLPTNGADKQPLHENTIGTGRGGN